MTIDVLVRFKGKLHTVSVEENRLLTDDELLRMAYNKLERESRHKHLEQVRTLYGVS